MTAQHLIELVLENAPGLDPSVAELYLNNAQRRFCVETRILRRKATLTLSGESKTHEIDSPDDIIYIRELIREGVELTNTNRPSYLKADEGFWYVQVNTPLTLYIAQWSGTAEVAFPDGYSFDMIYEAYPRAIATDDQDAEDYQAEPEIPSRFHEALVYRASEKAHFATPELRSYFYSLWRDEVKQGKQYAHEMNTNAKWHVKVHTL